MRISYESVSVKRGEKLVINNLTASMEGPGLYQVIGPNGAGKTTLLLVTLGVVKPVSGRVVVEPGNSERRTVSYMPQDFELPRDAPMSTYEFVENYLELWRGRFLKRDPGVDSRVREVLELVGIPRNLWNEKLTHLSGGMVKRALLARTLAPDTPIVLLDEPLSNIDPEGKVDVAEILGSLSRSKLIVITSHDPILLLEYTRKVLLLGYGYYHYGEPSEALKYEVLSKFYKKCAIELEKHVHIVDWH